MKKGALIFVGILAAAGIGFVVYRQIRKRTPDKLAIQISDVDWNKKTLNTRVTENGKFRSSGIENMNTPSGGWSTGKSSVSKQIIGNKMILTGESLGQIQFKKEIDFDAKTIKDVA